MFNQIVALILAATVLGCPLVCNEMGCCEASETVAVERHCCHDCHRDRPADGNDSFPTDDRSENGGCQCLCGGAVIEEHGPDVLHLDMTVWTASLAVETLRADAAQFSQAAIYRTPLPDDGTNAGRVIRCRLGSLIC